MKPSFYFNSTCNFYDLSDYSVIAYNLIRFQIIQAFLQKDIVFPLDFLDIIFICVLQNFQFFLCLLFIFYFTNTDFVLSELSQQIVKERIEGGANEKAALIFR